MSEASAARRTRALLAALAGLLMAVAVGCGGTAPSARPASAPNDSAVAAPTTAPAKSLTLATPTPGPSFASSVPEATATPTPALEKDLTYSRRTGFVPLDNPAFVSAAGRPDLGDDELVMGLEREGEARAYPVSMLRYHHIVNDTVAGIPLLVTY